MRKLLAIGLVLIYCSGCSRALNLLGKAPDSSDDAIIAQALKYKYENGGNTVVLPMTKLSFPYTEPKDISAIQEFAKNTLDIEGDILERLLNNFIEKNKLPVKLSLKSAPEDGYIVDHIGKLDEYVIEDKWDEWRKKYPTTHSWTTVSLPFYDRENGYVLLSQTRYGDWSSWRNELYLFTFKDGFLEQVGSVLLSNSLFFNDSIESPDLGIITKLKTAANTGRLDAIRLSYDQRMPRSQMLKICSRNENPIFQVERYGDIDGDFISRKYEAPATEADVKFFGQEMVNNRVLVAPFSRKETTEHSIKKRFWFGASSSPMNHVSRAFLNDGPEFIKPLKGWAERQIENLSTNENLVQQNCISQCSGSLDPKLREKLELAARSGELQDLVIEYSPANGGLPPQSNSLKMFEQNGKALLQVVLKGHRMGPGFITKTFETSASKKDIENLCRALVENEILSKPNQDKFEVIYDGVNYTVSITLDGVKTERSFSNKLPDFAKPFDKLAEFYIKKTAVQKFLKSQVTGSTNHRPIECRDY